MATKDLPVTVRRNLEQVKHCVEEAISVVNYHEDPGHALADIKQATELLLLIIKRLKEGT